MGEVSPVTIETLFESIRHTSYFSLGFVTRAIMWLKTTKSEKLANMRFGVKCSLCLLLQAFQGLQFCIKPNLTRLIMMRIQI